MTWQALASLSIKIVFLNADPAKIPIIPIPEQISKKIPQSSFCTSYFILLNNTSETTVFV